MPDAVKEQVQTMRDQVGYAGLILHGRIGWRMGTLDMSTLGMGTLDMSTLGMGTLGMGMLVMGTLGMGTSALGEVDLGRHVDAGQALCNEGIGHGRSAGPL
jgi:hypothetical protein